MKTNLTFLLLLISTGAAMQAADTPERKYQRTDRLDRLWLAEGFDFSGYDAAWIEEVKTDPEVKTKDEKEAERLGYAKASLPKELALSIEARALFKSVVTRESDLPKEGRTLRIQTTVLKFSRGSSSARYAVGFGAGMPYIKVRIQAVEAAGGKTLFECEIDEKGDWFGSGYTGSKTLQAGATMQLCDDVASYMSRVAKHEKIKYKPAK